MSRAKGRAKGVATIRSRRPFARLAGLALPIALAASLAALLAGCGLSAAPTTDTPAPTLTPITSFATPTPNPKTAVQRTVIQFCQALSDSNLAQAYAFLTPSYQQRAGSAANLPNVLEATWGTTTGCMEFGNGGFIQVSGNHASDQVEFTVNTRSFGTKTIGGQLNLAQSAGAWLIDSNT